MASNIKHCVVCGAEFSAPPSSKKITCSKACSAARKSLTHKGRPGKPLTDDQKQHLSSYRKAMPNRSDIARMGAVAAQKIPKCQPGAQNKTARVWHLIDPSGNEHVAISLQHWCLENAHLFGRDHTIREAKTIADGFRAIQRCMLGKTKRSVTTYFNWTLAGLSEPKGGNKMTDRQFYICWLEAGNYTDRDAYISDMALSSMWGDADTDEIPPERIEKLCKIWHIYNSSMRQIKVEAKITAAAMSERFVIPLRTIEDWNAGKRTPPDYVKIMIAKSLGLL